MFTLVSLPPLPLCPTFPTQTRTQPFSLCAIMPPKICSKRPPVQRCLATGAGGVAVSMPPDPECRMYANGSEWWATSEKDTIDPLNPSLPRAVSHPSETQHQNGV